MFMLAFHIIAVGLLVMIIGAVAYNLGYRRGERRTRRLLLEEQDAAQGS